MVQAGMITTALKSHFYIIVALASIVGSIIAVPHISNFVAVSSSDLLPFIPDAAAQTLPFTVDHHVKIKERVADTVRVEESMNDADRNCEMSCTYVRYQPGSKGEAGLAYIADIPLDLTGAKKVHFFLMGDKGGEMVKVKIAGKNLSSGQKADSPFKEKFAKSTGVITLSNDWKRYEISLAGVDLKGIVAPFAIDLLKGKPSATQAIYFKFIVYENQPVDQRFVLAANTTDNSTTSPIYNATADTSEKQITNSSGVTALEPEDNRNSPPIAMPAVDSVVAHPNDKVILDGSLSSDPDGDKITYHWSQSSGPGVVIIDADAATPTITIPNQEKDDKVTIDLVISDGQSESKKASVIINIQYVEEIEGSKEQNLGLDDAIEVKGWSDAACDSNNETARDDSNVIVNCLTDNSDRSFIFSESPSFSDLLFSFQNFDDPASIGASTSNSIAYVTAQVTVKKTANSSFISLLIDDPKNKKHYSTPSISILSDSFEEYSFSWKYNPLTGGPWTADSLNSLVAGYRYSAGEGSIEVSEFKLIVTTPISQEEQEPSSPSSSAIDQESGATEEDDINNNDTDVGNSTTTGAEEATRTDSDNSIDEDAPTEDNV
jgi:hypothetical protein